MKPRIYDVACNLFCRQFSYPEDIYREAIAEGIALLITGSDFEDNYLINDFLNNHDYVWGTLGIHPHNADGCNETNWNELINLKNQKYVAIGECGLDYNRMFSTKEKQIEVFKKHIVLALERQLPLYLHCREAFEDFFGIMSDYPELCNKSVIHCFTGTKQDALRALEMGFSLGITGWICDERRGQELQDIVKEIPLNRLLIETDSPYLLPRGFKLKNPNKPIYISYVLKALADILEMDGDVLAIQLAKNTKEIFKI